MVQITIGRVGQLQGSEANIVQGFVVNTVGFICIFNQLVDGKGSIVGFYHGIGYLGGGYHGVGIHDTVRVLLADLGNEKGTHT